MKSDLQKYTAKLLYFGKPEPKVIQVRVFRSIVILATRKVILWLVRRTLVWDR